MSQKKKTVGQLFTSFNERYKVDDVSKSVGLQTLYGYLSNQVKHNNGNYFHEPSEYIQTLIEKYLDYQLPKGIQFKSGESYPATNGVNVAVRVFTGKLASILNTACRKKSNNVIHSNRYNNGTITTNNRIKRTDGKRCRQV